MKFAILAIVPLLLTLVGCVSPPPAVVSIPPRLPPQVEAAFQDAEKAMTFPIAALVSFKKVLPTPYRNVHGEEWPVILRVHKLYGGKLEGDELGFGSRYPHQTGIQPKKLYFIFDVRQCERFL